MASRLKKRNNLMPTSASQRQLSRSKSQRIQCAKDNESAMLKFHNIDKATLIQSRLSNLHLFALAKIQYLIKMHSVSFGMITAKI